MIHKKHSLQTRLIAVLCFIMLGIGTARAVPELNWERYMSETGLFEVTLPEGQKTSARTFRIDSEHVIRSSETATFIDQRPLKNAVKSYIVKFDQTVGPGLTPREVERLLDHELKNYENHYRELNGVVKKKERILYRNLPGMEIYITYDDPELGEQGMRSRVIFSDVTKFQQILIGPDKGMYSYKAKDYFKSLVLWPGVSNNAGEFGEDWQKHVSPLEIFSVDLPPVITPYVLNEPTIQSTAKTERISHSIYDPIWSHKIFYNVYGHKFDANLTFADAQTVLLQRHLAKHKISYEKMNFLRSTEGDFPMLEIDLTISPPKEASYIRYLYLRAYFLNNYMVVQEIMSSHTLGKSAFTKNMLKFMEFHPEQAHKLYVKKKKKAAMARIKTKGPLEKPATK